MTQLSFRFALANFYGRPDYDLSQPLGPIFKQQLESRTGINPCSDSRIQYADHWTLSEWTVEVWLDHAWKTWMVQAVESHTGCTVPGDAPKQHKTLAQARADAARMFAVLTASMTTEAWPFGTRSKAKAA